MKGFEDDCGYYRNHKEGIQKNGKIIYRAPDSILVPSLMKSLFEKLQSNDINKLLLASLFHYYFVSIHPFTDGNKRMARFWSTLILIKYNNNFEFIPIEEEIFLNQEKYYEAIEKFNSSLDKIILNNNEDVLSIEQKTVDLISHNNHITQREIATKKIKAQEQLKDILKMVPSKE